ncbi:MAG: S8 family serine peptidase [Clostridia bacterium]|nr:S8 family serine peptidase [Clostridia bacterium]
MKKASAIFLVLCIILTQMMIGYAVSSDSETVETIADNTDFAVESAEIISDNEASMLRIIGKFRNIPSVSVFENAIDYVASDDGRFVMQFSSENELLECLDKLNKNPDVIYAEQDRPVYTQAVEESAEYLSWGVRSIEADVYSQSITPSEGESVTVAIVDSGCEDIDFIKDRLVGGYDFVENDSDATQDENTDSHGTFLASIVTDCTRNLPIMIMPVRVLSSKSGSLINLVNGIIFAADNGADIINISLTISTNNCKSLEDAVNYAESKNISVVTCAGNSKSNIEKICPAHNSNTITVTSINMYEEFSSSFSNFGSEVDVAAPGEIIIGYNALGEEAVLSGTSMSAAFVSAAAAMFRLKNPQCNTTQVRKAMIDSAEDRGDEGWDIYYGHGIIKLGALANSNIKYVESIRFSQDTYEIPVGNSLEINPMFNPEDASDKGFTLSSDSNCISINQNVITAVSKGKATVTVTSNDGLYTDIAEITVKAPVIKIKNNPGTKTINYGDYLRLTAEVTDRPKNAKIWWYVNGTKSAEGETFEISPESDSVTITAKLVDADGNAVLDSQGNEISDSETVTVNSGFFQKLISFFKNLFRMNRTVIQNFKKN